MVVAGAVALTVVFFLVLPVLQAINKPPTDGLSVRDAGVVQPPPPPPPEEEEPPEQEEQPEEKPELEEDIEPLDLSQLEIAINPGGGFGTGNMKIKIGDAIAKSGAMEELANMAELDQKPRVIYQPGPTLSSKLRKEGPATVYVIFIVNKQGKVEDARVQKSSNPIFNDAALSAVKKWKFDPGQRGGQPVAFRMRVPVSFPEPN